MTILYFLLGTFLTVFMGGLYYFRLVDSPRQEVYSASSTLLPVSSQNISKILNEIFFQQESYFSSWSWDKKLLKAEVVEVDYELKQLVMKTDLYGSYSLNGPLMRVLPLCEFENTFIASISNSNVSITGFGYNLFEQIEAGDVLISRCNEKECLNLVDPCIIVRNQ